MLNSKQLIEITPISRATLKNYVALGILSNPVIRAPAENEGQATGNDEGNHSQGPE